MRGKNIFYTGAAKSIEVRVENDKRNYGDIYYTYDGYQRIVMIGSYAVAKKYLSGYASTIRRYDYAGYVFQKLFRDCIGANHGIGWLAMKKPLNNFFNRGALEKTFPNLISHIQVWIDSNVKHDSLAALNSLGFDILTLKIMGQIVYGGLNDVLFNELVEIYRLHCKVMQIMGYDMTLRLNIHPTPNSRIVDSLRAKWIIFNSSVRNNMNADSLFANMIKMEAYDSVKLVQTLYEIVLFNADIMTDAFVNVFTNISQSIGIMQRIRHECCKINKLTNYQQIDELSFLTCVINESARLNPGIVQTFAETITQPMELGGFCCPANTLISLDTQMLNRDPDVWKNPHEFNPDRFNIESDSKQFYQYHRFGLGPRMCLGNIYADYILKSIIVMVLNKFDLTFVKRKVGNVRVSLPNMSSTNLDGSVMFQERILND